MQLPLAHHRLGGNGGGPVLLMLHANSLHSHVFLPMVSGLLDQHFGAIIALDAPGQGDSPWSELSSSAPATAEQMYQCVLNLGLQGCFAFGHSMGGALAALIEAAHPGTFRGIYMYEAPLRTPTGAAAEAARGASNAGETLGMLARKRRARFTSQPAALHSFAGKPPFSSWHPRCLELYVHHGTRAVGTQPRSGTLLGDSSDQQQQQQHQQHQQQQQSPSTFGSSKQSQQTHSGHSTGGTLLQGEVELCCSTATEGAVYAAFEPPPALPAHRLPRCPVAWAVGGTTEGVHARLPALAQDGVQDLAHGCLRRFPRLAHFGPQEDPASVANDLLAFCRAIAISRPYVINQSIRDMPCHSQQGNHAQAPSGHLREVTVSRAAAGHAASSTLAKQRSAALDSTSSSQAPLMPSKL